MRRASSASRATDTSASVESLHRQSQEPALEEEIEELQRVLVSKRGELEAVEGDLAATNSKVYQARSDAIAEEKARYAASKTKFAAQHDELAAALGGLAEEEAANGLAELLQPAAVRAREVRHRRDGRLLPNNRQSSTAGSASVAAHSMSTSYYYSFCCTSYASSIPLYLADCSRRTSVNDTPRQMLLNFLV